MNSNKIDLIKSIITRLETGIANHLEKSIIICLCQVSEVDQLDENNIKEISNKIIHNWEWMIRESEELLETKVDIANIRYKMDNKNLVRTLEPIHREIAIGKRLFIPIEKFQIEDNFQVCVLYNIIKTWLLFYYL